MVLEARRDGCIPRLTLTNWLVIAFIPGKSTLNLADLLLAGLKCPVPNSYVYT
jgi:hypothetical protein